MSTAPRARTTRLYIVALVALMASAVLFGAGAVAVLAVPSLNDEAAYWLPLVIVASFLLAPLVGFAIEPRMRAAWQRRHPPVTPAE